MAKRKRHFGHSGRKRETSELFAISSPEDTKRRRLSADTNDSNKLPSDSKNDSLQYGNNDDTDDQGWTTVSRKEKKQSGKANGRDSSRNHGRDDYPAIRIHQNYQSEVRTRDLQSLFLYVLADEVAPKWLAVKSAKSVNKVVCLMVPGLDKELLRVAQESSFRRSMNDIPHAQGQLSHNEETKTDPDEKIQDKSQLGINGANRALSIVEQSNSDNSLAWLFDDIVQVKAPGDAKASRVHSPLQAILLAPDNKQNPNRHNGYMPDRVAIAELIHTADELREAGFPIHPASFTTHLDAELEASRREQTGQSLKSGWVNTNVVDSRPKIDPDAPDAITQGLFVYSVDCEMVQTKDDAMALARVSVVSHPGGKVVIDKYVKQRSEVTNYFTQYSGITPQLLENVTTTLQDIQKELLELLTPSSVLLGHSLDSDLNALKLTHPFLIDTSVIYPHPRGLPLRSSLKYLANKYLKREIQTGGAHGHNSVEDAQAVLDLVKQKCEKGHKWGTIEANGEPIFRRLKKSGRTSAMVDYGTPERGLGREATHTIGCQNDDDVVKGVSRATKGDSFFDFKIPAGGVDFVWGRLRALEYARGWVSGASSAFRQPGNETAPARDDGSFTSEDQDPQDAKKVAVETLDRIQQIYNTLTAKALLIVFSGTSDVRPVMRLQAQQQQYRKEFKVKKWDELTVKWTDTEEQALRKACENARQGWAVCTIK